MFLADALRILYILFLLATVPSSSTLQGDINHDNVVDFADANVMRKSFGRCSGEPAHRPDADLNSDGCVDLKDGISLFANIGQSEVRVELVQLGDDPYALDSDDFIEITFAVAPKTLSLTDISLTVAGDSFGDGVEENTNDYVRFDWPYSDNQRVARIYLGRNVHLKLGGHANATRTTPGSPSGVKIRGVGVKDLSDRRTRLLQLAFDRYYRNYQSTVQKRAQSADACLDNYYLSYDLEGLLSMYEATRATQYLEQAMHFADTMLGSAIDRDNDGYMDFAGTTHTLNNNRPQFNIALCDWKAGRPIARLARLMDENSVFAGRYPGKRAQYRSIVDKHLVQKWSNTLNHNASKMFFPESVNFVESDDLIHRVSHYGDIVVDAWAATRQPAFETLLDSIVTRVCADLQDSDRHPGAIEWDIFMRPEHSKRDIVRLYGRPYDGISDTSHANGTVAFLVAAVLRADKKCRGRDVLADLALTFRTVITNPPNPRKDVGYRFADFVDGGVLADGQPPFSVGRFIEDGWLKLGEVDPEVQAIAQAFFDEGRPVHRLQYLGNLARNYSLAKWQ